MSIYIGYRKLRSNIGCNIRIAIERRQILSIKNQISKIVDTCCKLDELKPVVFFRLVIKNEALSGNKAESELIVFRRQNNFQEF